MLTANTGPIGNKNKRLKELQGLIDQGLVDSEVQPLLHLINSRNEYMTTSSCSGRIQLLEFKNVGDKQESSVLKKWHNAPTLEEFKQEIIQWKAGSNLYLMVQSPIFHIECAGLKSSVRLRNLGQQSSFKYSTIRSLRLNGEGSRITKITVELLSSETLHVPLGENGRIYPDTDQLEYLYNRALHHLKRCKENLKSLERALEEWE